MAAREGRACLSPRLPLRRARGGAASARAAADNLISKLRGEIERLRALLRGGADPIDQEVARREALARPVLKAKLAGSTVDRPQRLVRNVALHAEECPDAGAPLMLGRQLQKGPGLGAIGIAGSS